MAVNYLDDRLDPASFSDLDVVGGSFGSEQQRRQR